MNTLELDESKPKVLDTIYMSCIIKVFCKGIKTFLAEISSLCTYTIGFTICT